MADDDETFAAAQGDKQGSASETFAALRMTGLSPMLLPSCYFPQLSPHSLRSGQALSLR